MMSDLTADPLGNKTLLRMTPIAVSISRNTFVLMVCIDVTDLEVSQ